MSEENKRRIKSIVYVPVFHFDEYFRAVLAYIMESQPLPKSELFNLTSNIPPEYIKEVSSVISGKLGFGEEDMITKVISTGLSEVILSTLEDLGFIAKSVDEEGEEVLSVTRKGEMLLRGASSEDDYVLFGRRVEPEEDGYYLYPGAYIAVLDKPVNEPSIIVPDCELGYYHAVVGGGRIVKFTATVPLRVPAECTVRIYPLRSS